jgi:DNA-binding transcriptional MocR family regulator
MAGAPWLPDAWLDQVGIRTIVRRLARNNGDHLLGYGHPAGYLPLRQQLQRKLSELGIVASAEQIVLTYGTSQALDLVIIASYQTGRCRAGGRSGLLQRVRLPAHVRRTTARRAAQCRRARRRRAAASGSGASPQGVFHANGHAEPDRHRHESCGDASVLQASDELDLTIVEDDTYCDLQSASSPRLATLDELNRVIYVRSFSKTLSGSLARGFLAARTSACRRLHQPQGAELHHAPLSSSSACST